MVVLVFTTQLVALVLCVTVIQGSICWFQKLSARQIEIAPGLSGGLAVSANILGTGGRNSKIGTRDLCNFVAF